MSSRPVILPGKLVKQLLFIPDYNLNKNIYFVKHYFNFGASQCDCLVYANCHNLMEKHMIIKYEAEFNISVVLGYKLKAR